MTAIETSEVTQTTSLYAFKTGASSFPNGETVFRTPLGKDGFCLTFGNGANCSHVQPDAKTPVIGFGTDLDSEGAGVPFVLFGIKAANVTNVIYRCAGSERQQPWHENNIQKLRQRKLSFGFRRRTVVYVKKGQ